MLKGIVRKLDELGRATIPIEMRRELGFEDKGKVEIYIENGVICIKPYNAIEECACCSKTEKQVGKLVDVNGLKLCMNCGKLVSREVSILQEAEMKRLHAIGK